MSKHWAKIEEDLVVNVIYGDTPLDDGEYIEFSHTGEFRANPAIIGSPYDRENDVFITPKPHASWVMDENFRWVSPVGDKPSDGPYRWDEANTIWVKIGSSAQSDH